MPIADPSHESNDPVTRKINAWCDALMDLTRRNPLLSLPKSSIPLPDAPDTLWQMPREGARRIRLVSEKFPGTDIARELKSHDRPLTMERYRQLKTAFMASRRSMEEQGLQILFVTAGILEWREPGKSEPVRSPLLLLPVTLERLPMDTGYFLSALDDEPRLNPTLSYRLSQPDIQIALPTWSEDRLPGDYLVEFARTIPGRFGATVHLDATYLGRFSYLNLTMYEEISTRIEQARNHPLIAAVAGDSRVASRLPRAPFWEPDSESPATTFHVLSADPSQEEAISAARQGTNLVIEGPPGTGKTQTITNLIATCIADGKRILFVSEKMAALSAVYRRLKAQGLSDLCLEAHSHRAGKAELLAQLKRSRAVATESSATSVRQSMDANALTVLRSEFNQGIASLHEPVLPLGISIYEARGVVASLALIPDMFFALPDVSNVDGEQLFHLEELTRRFAAFYDLYPRLERHPWRGLRATQFRQELPEQITQALLPWSNGCERLRMLARELSALLQIPTLDETTLRRQDIDWLTAIASQSLATPCPLTEWVDGEIEDLVALQSHARSTGLRYSDFQNRQSLLLRDFAESVLTADQVAIIQALRSPALQLTATVGYSWADNPDIAYAAAIAAMEAVTLAIDQLLPGAERLAHLAGVDVPTSRADIETLLRQLEPCRQSFQPCTNWFDVSIDQLTNTLRETSERYSQRDLARLTVGELFTPTVYQLDVRGLQQRYETEYIGIERFLKSGFWKDQKALNQVLLPSQTVKGIDIPTVLQSAVTAMDCEDYLSGQQDNLRRDFGTYFAGADTYWERLSDNLKITKTLRSQFPTGVPKPLQEILCLSGARWEELRDQIELVSDRFAVYSEQFQRLELQIQVPIEASLPKHRVSLVVWRDSFNQLRAVMQDFVRARTMARRFARGDRPTDTLIRGLEEAFAVITEEKAIEADFPVNQARFGALYADWRTDWERIDRAIDNATRVRNLANKRYVAVPPGIVQLCTDPKQQEIDGDRIRGLVTDIELIRISLESTWANDLPVFFDMPRLVALGMGVTVDSPVMAQRNWSQERLSALAEIERYLQLITLREHCDSAGLLSFCEQIILEQPPQEQISLIFRKAFHRRWVDFLTSAHPAVQPLTIADHTPRQTKFVALDKEQLRKSPARIRDRVAERRELIFGAEFNVGEMAVLNRYLAQVRPRASVRKILSDIPNLLFKLTPCVMMSPLSVSLFLDPDRINFDIVIFDEASQVFPEYALGALLRANQAVIAGDSKQLPPTPFFKKTQDLDGFEDDEEADPREFESVLDAAKSAFSQTTLNWHYRSRHESLIQFSNEHIYVPDNMPLNTFPSARTPSALSLEYVEDGVYYGGKTNKRDNPVEAARIVSLVIDQVRGNSNQTVGVITMSGAQEDCVRAALENATQLDSSLASALNEHATDTSEPFFIKSIEDVQGDERDVIFLSIGYGRWPDGKVKMLFGPLSRNGGERRLNVAITRARERLTVVSSIRSTELTTTSETKRGVILLQRFLAQAQSASHSPIAGKDESDDRFVESVAVALEKRGHQVRRQIGTSEYRVDLGIIDPNDPNSFLLGIECDSENYRNGRTARARERLRGEVLTGLGWRLLRIWSADWLRQPDAVIQRIETALQAPANPTGASESDTAPVEEDISIEVTQTDDAKIPLPPVPATDPLTAALLPGLSYFVPVMARLPGEETTLYGNTRGDSLTRAEYLLSVVQQEEPVHLDVLVQRLRQAAGLNRSGSQIKRIVDNAVTLLEQATKVERRGSFIVVAGNVGTPARIPRPGDPPRIIDHISRDEIAEVALVIIRQSGGVRNDEAILETARQFGFDRTGTTIRERIQEAISSLEYDNRIIVQNGQIRTLE